MVCREWARGSLGRVKLQLQGEAVRVARFVESAPTFLSLFVDLLALMATLGFLHPGDC